MLKKIACTAAAIALTIGFTLAPLRPAAAGASGGPRNTGWRTLWEGYEVSYQVTFRGGERAVVSAQGDGDIDLEVRDSAGRLVGYDDDLDSVPVVGFTPRWTETYTITVINSEDDDVVFRMRTN